jgi:ligand-binding sensor domain-containing protein
MFTIYVLGEDADSRNVSSLFEDRNGSIWCGTAAGLYRLEEQNREAGFRSVELGIRTQITSTIEDRHGAIWIGSINGIYRLVREGRGESYQTSHGLPNDHIHSLLEDREGRIWVGTRARGLCRLVSDSESTRPVVARFYTAKDGLPAVWINQIFQASDGSLWAGSNQGLIRFVPTGSDFRFRVYSEPNGLSFREVESLAEDRNHNLWLGIAGSGGAVKLARSGFTAFAEADGLRGPNAIFKDRAGDLFIKSGSRLGVEVIKRYEASASLSFNSGSPGKLAMVGIESGRA